MKLVLTQKEPIDINSILTRGALDSDGSDIVFIGKVRNSSRGKKVTHIDYEIYPEMAVRELNKIVDEAMAGNETGRVAVVHRFGRVTVGEASIVILVSSPHRDSSYTASRYIIDEIKKRVPIWKKEFYDDGSEWISDRS